MPLWLATGIGGFAGAVLRMRISESVTIWAATRTGVALPAGTLCVNIAGCLLIGVLMTLAENQRLSAETQKLLITGCLGSLTTFSTFGFETVVLVREQRPVAALVYVLASVIIGLLAVLAGVTLARLGLR